MNEVPKALLVTGPAILTTSFISGAFKGYCDGSGNDLNNQSLENILTFGPSLAMVGWLVLSYKLYAQPYFNKTIKPSVKKRQQQENEFLFAMAGTQMSDKELEEYKIKRERENLSEDRMNQRTMISSYSKEAIVPTILTASLTAIGYGAGYLTGISQR